MSMFTSDSYIAHLPPVMQKVLLSLFLVMITLTIYVQTSSHNFCLLDDVDYVQNAVVLKGLTAEGAKWAFTSIDLGNWIPFTWLSLMLDVELFGPDAGKIHLVNMILHAINSLLLFHFLARITGTTWRSWLVAILFAIHPLHVESVAWIAERKDLLSALFFFLALIAWNAWTSEERKRGYFIALLLFIFALMAKPMIVTFPLVLFLLDLWPLGRWRHCSVQRLIAEKIPFLLFSAVFSLVTLNAQKQTISSIYSVTPVMRVCNSLQAYGLYLRKMLWPSDLAILYPFPTSVPVRGAALSVIFLLAVTAVAVWMRGKRPWLLVGWMWYIGMLVPVIGIIQVGFQSMADRYSYLPLVGIYIILSWGAAELASVSIRLRRGVVAVAAVVCVLLVIVTWRQIALWKDDVLLFSRSMEVSPINPAAWQNLVIAHLRKGMSLRESGKYNEALAELRIAAGFTGTTAAVAHNEMGLIHAIRNEEDAALGEFRAAINSDRSYMEPYRNIELLYLQKGLVK